VNRQQSQQSRLELGLCLSREFLAGEQCGSLMRKIHGSLNSPACSCVSITLRVYHKREWQRDVIDCQCFAYPIAFLTSFASPYQSQPNGSGIENQIDATMIFARFHVVNVLWHVASSD